MAGSAALSLLVLATLSFRQNLVWRSAETLWQHTIRISPQSVKAYTNLGRIYFSAGRYAEAFARFDQARQLAPADPHYDFFTGLQYFIRSDYSQALHHFGQAEARDPNFLEVLFHTGMAHEALGHRDQVRLEVALAYRAGLAAPAPQISALARFPAPAAWADELQRRLWRPGDGGLQTGEPERAPGRGVAG